MLYKIKFLVFKRNSIWVPELALISREWSGKAEAAEIRNWKDQGHTMPARGLYCQGPGGVGGKNTKKHSRNSEKDTGWSWEARSQVQVETRSYRMYRSLLCTGGFALNVEEGAEGFATGLQQESNEMCSGLPSLLEARRPLGSSHRCPGKTE